MILSVIALPLALICQGQPQAKRLDASVSQPLAASEASSDGPALLDQQVHSDDGAAAEPVAVPNRPRAYQRFIVRRLPGGSGEMYEVEVLRDEPVSPALVSSALVTALERGRPVESPIKQAAPEPLPDFPHPPVP